MKIVNTYWEHEFHDRGKLFYLPTCDIPPIRYNILIPSRVDLNFFKRIAICKINIQVKQPTRIMSHYLIHECNKDIIKDFIAKVLTSDIPLDEISNWFNGVIL